MMESQNILEKQQNELKRHQEKIMAAEIQSRLVQNEYRPRKGPIHRPVFHVNLMS